MKTIHKYPLQIIASQVVIMPRGGEIIAVQTQGQVPCIWAMVDPDNDVEMRIIEMFGTGDTIHDKQGKRRYIGTFQIKSGESVFHAFEYVRSGETEHLARK
jgi:hypothetical protein